MTIRVERDRVGRILVRGKTSNWQAVREGLIAKYGKPSSVEKPVVTFGSGAKGGSEDISWRLGDQTVTANMHVNATDFGIALSVDWFDADECRVSEPPGKDM